MSSKHILFSYFWWQFFFTKDQEKNNYVKGRKKNKEKVGHIG